ncbi:DUF2752 domain-containing protein [bacterium]|nr:DUF2752 domain-containing protein [bacterium]
MNRINQHLVIALVSTLILVGAWLSVASTGGVNLFGIRIPTLCGFKLLTTWDCPGCGLTRSLIYALHGEFTKSYAMHIWGIPLLIVLLFQVPYRMFRYLNPGFHPWKMPDRFKKWISPAIFLSLILPWTLKTIVVAVIRYL